MKVEHIFVKYLSNTSTSAVTVHTQAAEYMKRRASGVHAKYKLQSGKPKLPGSSMFMLGIKTRNIKKLVQSRERNLSEIWSNLNVASSAWLRRMIMIFDRSHFLYCKRSIFLLNMLIYLFIYWGIIYFLIVHLCFNVLCLVDYCSKMEWYKLYFQSLILLIARDITFPSLIVTRCPQIFFMCLFMM